MASANAVPVTYEISNDYKNGSFSASWLHGATGCSNSTGPQTGSTLYMCGDPLYSVTGTIKGNLVGGLLAITGGSLLIDGLSYAVGGSGFPPDYIGSINNGAVGAFSIEDHGYFIFEYFDMGSGRPNFFDGDTLILWGQNIAAYSCAPGQKRCFWGERWGIDLYGKRVAVPEPGTLALFGLGLLALGAIRRRRMSPIKA